MMESCIERQMAAHINIIHPTQHLINKKIIIQLHVQAFHGEQSNCRCDVVEKIWKTVTQNEVLFPRSSPLQRHNSSQCSQSSPKITVLSLNCFEKKRNSVNSVLILVVNLYFAISFECFIIERKSKHNEGLWYF